MFEPQPSIARRRLLRHLPSRFGSSVLAPLFLQGIGLEFQTQASPFGHESLESNGLTYTTRQPRCREEPPAAAAFAELFLLTRHTQPAPGQSPSNANPHGSGSGLTMQFPDW